MSHLIICNHAPFTDAILGAKVDIFYRDGIKLEM